MSDVRDVDWLPIDAALERLTRTHERDFLADIAPLAAKTRRLNGSQSAAARSRANGGFPASSDRKRANKSGLSATADKLVTKRDKSGRGTAARRRTNKPIGIFQRFQNWFRDRIHGGS